MTPTPLESLITNLGLIVSSVVGWVSSVAGAITSNPIILVPFALGIIGFGAGLFLRLARPN